MQINTDHALDFAIGFMEGFEGDAEQEGLTEALHTLRTAREQGYRLVCQD